MTQNRTQRRAMRAAAERRAMVPIIESTFGREAVEVLAALEMLGVDELRAFHRFAVTTARGRREVAGAFLERLLIGRAGYGELELDRDPRDWQRELAEELIDAEVYRVFAEIAEQEAGEEVWLQTSTSSACCAIYRRQIPELAEAVRVAEIARGER